MAFRRISSVFLMAGLLTVIYPFSPFAWVLPSPSGPHLLDGFISPALLVGALCFQWQIAGVIAPTVIQVVDFAFVYKQDMYWQLAFVEVVICVIVNLAENEMLRRLSAAGCVGVLWGIGWSCTPQRYKDEAWDRLKWIWTWMAFHEASNMVRGGRRRW
jgi:hypothetical protein